MGKRIGNDGRILELRFKFNECGGRII